MGKTVLAVNQLIKRAITDDKNRGSYGYVAPFRTQAKSIAWEYLKRYTGPIPGREVNESELFVALPNGAKIRLFGADNPDALRGLYFDGLKNLIPYLALHLRYFVKNQPVEVQTA
jgi:hypothetical protein